MAKIVDEAILKDDQYLKALKNIDRNIQAMSSSASKGFGGIDRTAQASGVKIGAVAGIVTSLTTEFINLGKRAIDTLTGIAEQGTRTALDLDTLRAQLLSIFGESKVAANEAFNFIQKKSKELGIDLTELSAIFLPKVESLEQFEKLAKLATAIARTSPQGQQAAIIGLTEALTGQFTSLQRRANIAKSDVDQIKKAFEEGGVEGFLEELDAVLQRTGRSFEATADTAQAAMNKVGIAGKQLGGILGEPIVEELKEQFDDLGAVLEERDVDFTKIAERVGEVAASVVDFIGTNLADFLANLDTEQVLEIVDGFQSMADTAFDLVEILGALEWPQGFLDGLETSVKKLDEALTTATKLSGLAKAELARGAAEREAAGVTPVGTKIKNLLSGDFSLFSAEETGASDKFLRYQLGLLSEGEEAEIAAAGEKAYQEVLKETVAILDETTQAEEDREAARAKRTTRRDSDESGAADAILAELEAARQAAAALEAYDEAKKKVTESTTKLETELEQEASDILLDVERKRFDALQDFGEKRAQAARKNLQKIEDIQRDFGRDLEDIDRKQGRERIEADKEEAQKQVDIEEEFQRELADIRNRFAFDLEDAARRRDAVTFLRLQRQQQEEIQQATTGRDRDIDDTKEKADQRREELRQRQQWEEEDARISLERKLEDQRIARAREFEEIRLAEIIKEQEIKTWQERQLDDLNTANQRKQEALEASLAAELELIREYEAQKTAVMEIEAARREQLERQANSSRRSQDRASQDRINAQVAQGRTVIAGRASGGPVAAGQPYVVGESGPELFVPGNAGAIVPSTMLMGTIPSRNVINNIDNSRSASLGGLVDPGSLDPILAAKVQNLMISLLSRM